MTDVNDSHRLNLLTTQLTDAADHFDKHGLEDGLNRWNEKSVSSLLRRLAKQARE